MPVTMIDLHDGNGPVMYDSSQDDLMGSYAARLLRQRKQNMQRETDKLNGGSDPIMSYRATFGEPNGLDLIGESLSAMQESAAAQGKKANFAFSPGTVNDEIMGPGMAGTPGTIYNKQKTDVDRNENVRKRARKAIEGMK